MSTIEHKGLLINTEHIETIDDGPVGRAIEDYTLKITFVSGKERYLDFLSKYQGDIFKKRLIEKIIKK